MIDKPFLVPIKNKFNLVCEFEEELTDDERVRTISTILNLKGIKSMSWSYPEECKNKILISIMDHLETLKNKEL